MHEEIRYWLIVLVIQKMQKSKGNEYDVAIMKTTITKAITMKTKISPFR